MGTAVFDIFQKGKIATASFAVLLLMGL